MTIPARLAQVFEWLMKLLQAALTLGGAMVTGIVSGIALDGGPIAAVALTLAHLALALCVHEGGHWLGARWDGLTVLLVRVLAVEIQPMRRGLRVRWSRQKRLRGLGGYVFCADAVPPRGPRARIRMVALGPGANLLLAALAALVALLCIDSPPAFGIALGMASSNLSMGLANLVPTLRPMPSDGARLFMAWRGADESGPAFAYARLLALSVAGVPAEALPEADLASLEQQPMPMPLVALSYRLDRTQAVGDWAAATAMQAQLEALLTAHPQARTECAAVVALLRGELAFSQAMASGRADGLDAVLNNREVAWYSPTLPARCRALQALFSGDEAGAERELEAAVALGANARVRSSHPLQLALAGHVRALFKGRTAEGALHVP